MSKHSGKNNNWTPLSNAGFIFDPMDARTSLIGIALGTAISSESGRKWTIKEPHINENEKTVNKNEKAIKLISHRTNYTGAHIDHI